MIDKISNTIVNDKVKSVYGFNDYSIQDLLSKFFEQINSVTDLVNQNEEKINTQNFKLEEFINYMKNEGIPPIVIETVTTMYNDGRLTELFNNLANNVIDKVEEFKTQVNSQLEQITTMPSRINGEVNYTNALKRAIEKSDNILIPHDIEIDGNIILNKNTKIYSNKRDVKIICNSDNFMFIYLSELNDTEYDDEIGISFDNITLDGKNLIKINDFNTNTFYRQGALKGLKITNCILKGKSTHTTNKTKVLSRNELIIEGVGISCAKIFDSIIKGNQIQGFGIGFEGLGCDLNTLEDNRFAYNDRPIHLTKIGTWGSQNKINHNDICVNYRKGFIYDEGGAFNTIKDNYFECYDIMGLFIYGDNVKGLNILENRFDDSNQQDTELVYIAPCSEVMSTFANNRCNPGNGSRKIIVDDKYFNQKSRGLLNYYSNSEYFNCDMYGVFKNKINPLIFRYDNFQERVKGAVENNMGVAMSKPNAFVKSEYGWKLNNTSSLLYRFDLSGNLTKSFKMILKGKFISGNGGWCTIKCNDTQIYSGGMLNQNITIVEKEFLHSDYIKYIDIELSNNELDLYEIEIIPYTDLLYKSSTIDETITINNPLSIYNLNNCIVKVESWGSGYQYICYNEFKLTSTLNGNIVAKKILNNPSDTNVIDNSISVSSGNITITVTGNGGGKQFKYSIYRI